jgi:hypothetical protein
VQFEVAAAGGHHHHARDTRRPDDLIVDQPLDMLEDGIAVITGFGQCRIRIGSQSESLAPRSTLSIHRRSSSKGTRSLTEPTS